MDVTAPVTTITAGPGVPPAATFSFVSTPGATFECRLDTATFAPCASPITYSAPTPGQHQFLVRARDNSGKLGPVATRTWTVN